MFSVPPLDFGTLSSPKHSPAKKSRTATVPIEQINPVARSAVAIEYTSIRHDKHCPLGIYLVPHENNMMLWEGVFFVHQGYYADAALKFRLLFPPNYPERPPILEFTSAVFHPLVSSDGLFNLAPRFRPWRPKEHHVFDVLHWLKASFKKQALDSIKDHDCLNREAFRLYHESTTTFANLASQTANLSQSSAALFHRDPASRKGKPQGFVFNELPQEQLEVLRTELGLQEWSLD